MKSVSGLDPTFASREESPSPFPPTTERREPSTALLAFFFIGSGFSALAYQVILSRYVQLIVGATAYAISALLVAFMLGMSLGSALGGRWADRTTHPLRVYAWAEGAIGAYCVLFPFLFPVFQDLYLEIVPPIDAASLASRNLIRFVLGVTAFLLPSIFMGMTTPAFARAVAENRPDSGRWLARLYGWNTLGAACGAFASAYLLVPKLGLVGSMLLAAGLNFAIAVLAYQRSRPCAPVSRLVPRERKRDHPGVLEALRLEPLRDLARIHLTREGLTEARRHLGRLWDELRESNLAGPAVKPTLLIFLAVAFASGFLSFALEIVWTHLLAVLLGNSIYAFGLMLGSLLLGLAIGTLFAQRLSEPKLLALNWVGTSLALAGLFVLLSLEIWDEIPSLFLLFARSSPNFLLMEGVRFVVALFLMLAPTASFGIAFPLILRSAAAEEWGFGRRVGLVYAVNTVGAVLGAIAGSYWLLPGQGSLDSLRLLGALLLAVGGVAILFLSSMERRKAIAAICVSALFWAWSMPVQWDFNSLNMAAAIYLGSSTSQEGKIIYKREHPTGGLVSVVESKSHRGASRYGQSPVASPYSTSKRIGVRTLLTNGKFEGDNSEEVPIQHRLANIPTLFTKNRERALVIGLGTGVTLAAVAAHGFQKVVCAEISDPIVEAADKYFADVNGGVLDWPNVTLLHEDGRSVLFERPDRYDVISVEVTTIWFAGVGSIYSQEFYRLASRRLRRNGVLLQWFPIHHLSPRNLFLVVNTVRSAFPYVSVWTHRHQGFVVASNEPLMIDLDSIREDQDREQMQPYFRELDSGSPLELLSDLVVTDRDVDRFLDSMALLLMMERSVVSTDTWPTLEYETPKDILENFSYFQNRATFQRFRSKRPFPYRGAPSAGEQALAEAAFRRGWDDPGAIPRLAKLWAEHSEMSDVASKWLSDELSGSDVVATDADPLGELHASISDIESFVSTTEVESNCDPVPKFVSRLRNVPLAVESHSGHSLDGTRPEAVLDGTIDPALGTGWRTQPDGRSPRIDLKLEHAQRIENIRLVVEPIDGSIVRARLLGRNASGRWLPLASGARDSELLCRDIRKYRLNASAPVLTALRIELQGEALSHRIALHEVWIEGRE